MNTQVITIHDNAKTASLLREIAKPITEFGSDELEQLVNRLFKIMGEANGAGLAAPQIGVSERVFVYGFDFNPRYPDAAAVPKTVVINPEVLWKSEETAEYEEGCLSVPSQRGFVTRHKSVIFTTMDINGIMHEKTVTDFEARIVQHEIDHLNGILFSDLAKVLRDSTL